ncbi:hypothetical protein ES705_28918 [subsurface metagenome]
MMNIATILAILCITALEVIALCNGINGALLAGSIAIIAGLGGYQAHRVVTKKKGNGKPPSE